MHTALELLRQRDALLQEKPPPESTVVFVPVSHDDRVRKRRKRVGMSPISVRDSTPSQAQTPSSSPSEARLDSTHESTHIPSPVKSPHTRNTHSPDTRRLPAPDESVSARYLESTKQSRRRRAASLRKRRVLERPRSAHCDNRSRMRSVKGGWYGKRWQEIRRRHGMSAYVSPDALVDDPDGLAERSRRMMMMAGSAPQDNHMTGERRVRNVVKKQWARRAVGNLPWGQRGEVHAFPSRRKNDSRSLQWHGNPDTPGPGAYTHTAQETHTHRGSDSKGSLISVRDIGKRELPVTRISREKLDLERSYRYMYGISAPPPRLPPKTVKRACKRFGLSLQGSYCWVPGRLLDKSMK